MSNAKTYPQTPQKFDGKWETKQLGDIAHIKTGSKNNEDKDENGQYPLFVRSAIVERINSYCYDGEAILVPGEGGIENIFHYINGRFDCHQRVYMINRFTDDVYGKLVYYSMVLQFGGHAMKNTVKATVDSLRLPTFKSFSFSIPKDGAEQRAIAEVLSDVDGLLNALEALIAKKQAIKHAVMQQLLTGKTRLPGFRGVWEMKRLGDIAQIKKGSMITEKDVVLGTIPVIAGGQKPAYYHNTANRTGKTITVSASGAYAGFVALYSQPIFASDCSTISESSRYSIDFIYYYLVFNQNVIYNAQTGGAQPHCYPTDLMAMQIDLPAIGEQRAIANVLSDMDAEIAALEQRRDKTRAIKQGMMQQLLTGRVRLVKNGAE